MTMRIRRILLWLIAAVMLTVTCVPAMAAPGDRTLLRTSNADGMISSYIEYALVSGQDVYFFMNGMTQELLKYTDFTQEPEKYQLSQDEETDYLAAMAEGEEQESERTVAWFSWNDAIYAIRVKTFSTMDSSRIEGGMIRKLVLENGEAKLEETDLPQLDWSNMIEDYGNYQGSRYLNNLIVNDNRLAGMTYDENGQSVLIVFDLTTGYAEEIALQDISDVYAGPDGSLLMVRYEWAEETKAILIRFDPDSQSEEEIASLPAGEEMLQSVCYDEKTGILYYVSRGEIWAAQDLDVENAVAVNDCPSQSNGHAALLADGNLLLWSQNAAVIRNTDPAQRSQASLVVQDYVYSESMDGTIFDFSNAHGEMSVILRRGGDKSQVLQAMMNRDSQVDIYVLPYESSEFEALRNRGFLADLSGNAQITDAMARMYPFVQDALQKDGKILAVPAYLGGSALCLYSKTWEKVGGTAEELPKTWEQFFDWIESLSGRLEGTGIGVFDQWISGTSIRYSVLTMIMNQYQVYLEEEGRDYAFNTPLLQGLLKRLDALNLEAMGIPDDLEEREEEAIEEEQEYKEPLLETYGSVTISSWSGDTTPLLLSLAEGEDPILPVTMNVAFVNPFSAHAEEAAEFLAMSLNNMQSGTQYSLFTDKTEPLRYPDYEETKENIKQWLEEAQKLLEGMDEDDENYEMMKESVESYEKYISEFDDTYWMISPAAVTGYQERIPWIRPMSYDFVSSMVGDQNGNYYELVDGYIQRQISPEELLAGIEKKVQMMRLEGN